MIFFFTFNLKFRIYIRLKTNSHIYFIIAIPVTIIFWCLDSYYLKMERQYRDLYSHVLVNKYITDFNMKASGYKQSFWKAMWWSWSTTPLYLSVLALLGIAIYLITR